MKHNLFSRYFAVFAGVILICITFLGTMLLIFSSQYFQRDKELLLEKNLSSAQSIIISNFESNDEQYINKTTLESTFALISEPIDATLYFCDLTGDIIICGDYDLFEYSTVSISEDLIFQIVDDGEYFENGNLEGIFSSSYFTAATPVVIDNTVVGVIFASTTASGMVDYINEILVMFFIAAIAVLIFAFFIVYFTTYNMVKPLRQMSYAAKRFATGDFTVRVESGNYAEMDQLAEAFNNMASSLSELEGSRRSFVANVSHELKTPMTTIGGFVDGILDGTIPPENQAHYLNIVSDEVKRLSRLVRSMLTLSRLEMGSLSLSYTSFNVVPVLQEVLFSFEKTITTKNISIEGLDIPKCYVSADKDLIHQVIYNLVENAVKFTPQDGYINFSLVSDGNDIFINIENSGDGLTKEEVSNIFDRFYKTDKSRGLDKDGVGLGLNIVKNIMHYHNGDIIVKSKVGKLTSFTIKLPENEKEGN